jgi:hypothetical protein
MTGLSREAPDGPAANTHCWRRKFEDSTIVVQRIRNLPKAEAELAAFDIVLVEFLNATHSDTDPSRCVWCGRPETPEAALLPIGVGARHAWLHDDCWAPWREARRKAAIETLAAMGIGEPAPRPMRAPSGDCRSLRLPEVTGLSGILCAGPY